MGAPNHHLTKAQLTEILEGWRDNHFELTDWESDFVISCEKQEVFTMKQEAVIRKLHDKHC
jgi:hypothetical protein